MAKSSSSFDFTIPPFEAGFKLLNIESRVDQLFLKIVFYDLHLQPLLSFNFIAESCHSTGARLSKILDFIWENTLFT